MKTKIIICASCIGAALTMSSCASLFTKSSQEITFKGVPGTTIVDTDKGNLIAEVGTNGFTSAKVRRQLSTKHLQATRDGYNSRNYQLGTKIQPSFWGNILLGGIPGMAIDVATGKMMKYKDKFIDVTLLPIQSTPEPNTITEQAQVVTVEYPGATDMEKNIIRWYIDSDPRGARIFYRIISSNPAEVKNTNETYLTTTPLEETKSFNIKGLTYENAPDVTIEIKVTKRGYEEQVKRYNVRQAIDQQEISGFFELVPKE